MFERVFEFIWMYLVGPIVADALNSPTAVWNGVTAHAGYNVFNTITYVVLALAVFYGIYRLFDRLEIQFDLETVLYTVPYVVLGGLVRFLQDAALIPYPYSILAITPLIYIMVALTYLISMLAAYRIDRDKLDKYIGVSGILFLAPVLALTVLRSYELGIDLLFVAYSLLISVAMTVPLYLYLRSKDLKPNMYGLAGFSQFFEGSVSMLSVMQGAEQKQLLAQLSTDIFGPSGILLVKVAIVSAAIYVLKDLEDVRTEAMVVLALLSVGLGTGIRVLMRTATGV